MAKYFTRFWFDFVWAITTKEIKARYKRAFLGFLWIVLNPILQMLVVGFIFQFFIQAKVDNYFHFLFAGLLPWNFFSYTVIKCTPLYLDERPLIQKAKFPREALVLSIVLSNLFHFLISLLLLVVLSLFISVLSLGKVFLLFIAIVLLVIFTTGLSFLLSTLFVKYRDMKFIVQAVMPLWFYATPILYTRSLLPHWVSRLILFNPTTIITEVFQYVFVDTPFDFNLLSMLPSAVIFFLVVIAGVFLFIKQSPYFDDWL